MSSTAQKTYSSYRADESGFNGPVTLEQFQDGVIHLRVTHEKRIKYTGALDVKAMTAIEKLLTIHIHPHINFIRMLYKCSQRYFLWCISQFEPGGWDDSSNVALYTDNSGMYPMGGGGGGGVKWK